MKNSMVISTTNSGNKRISIYGVKNSIIYENTNTSQHFCITLKSRVFEFIYKLINWLC